MADKYRMLAKTLYGLEDVLAGELRALGASGVQTGVRCVYFEGDTGFMYKANLNLRTALRVLMPVTDFRLARAEQLYDRIREIEWWRYLDSDCTLAVDTVLVGDLFANSLFVSQKVKDAIVDQFRDRTGKRPSVSVSDPDVRINIHVQGTLVHVSLDSSGGSLHLRGYREETNKAPLNEVLAAGILMLSGWTGQGNFLDPMCGSGTIAIEAGMIACNIPASINRKEFGFMRWPGFDRELFELIREAGLKRVREFHYRLRASDKAPSAVRKTAQNIRNANLQDFIQVDQADFFQSAKPDPGPLQLVTNPPYGERLLIDREGFYGKLGDTLKQGYSNTRASMLVGDPELLKYIGLRTSRKIKLYNGSLDSRLGIFDIYEGTRKGGRDDK